MARGRGVAAAVDAARHRDGDRQPAARRPRARASCTRRSRSSSTTCGRSASSTSTASRSPGEMIRELQGMDGLFIYYVLFNHQLDYVELRAARRVPGRSRHHPAHARPQGRGREARVDAREAARAARRATRRSRGRTSRREYEKEHPRELTKIELIHQRVRRARCRTPSCTAARSAKNMWAQLEDGEPRLPRVRREARPRARGGQPVLVPRARDELRAASSTQASQLSEFEDMAERVQKLLARIDVRDDRERTDV